LNKAVISGRVIRIYEDSEFNPVYIYNPTLSSTNSSLKTSEVIVHSLVGDFDGPTFSLLEFSKQKKRNIFSRYFFRLFSTSFEYSNKKDMESVLVGYF